MNKNKRINSLLLTTLPLMIIGMFVAVFYVLNSYADTKVKTIPLRIGKEQFVVEIADTTEKQLLGLMYRKVVPDNYGMLFVYEDEDRRGFWMKNTKVHLDMIHLDANKQVVDMFINVPPCKREPCQTYISERAAQYVLELRGNRATELNLKIGDPVFFILDN